MKHIQCEVMMCRWESKYYSLQDAYKSIWTDYMGVQMLALDAIFPQAPKPDGSLRRIQSPATHRQLHMAHPMMLKHRLFNFLDLNSDGVVGFDDVCQWSVLHIRHGTLDVDALWYKMTKEERPDRELTEQEERRLVTWHAGEVMDMLDQAFAPHTTHLSWKVFKPHLPHHQTLYSKQAPCAMCCANCALL